MNFREFVNRPKFPSWMVAELRRRVAGVQAVSNPVRVRYCTQEIFVLREAVVERLLENSLCPLAARIRRELTERDRDGKPPSEEDVERELQSRIPAYACFPSFSRLFHSFCLL